MIDCKVMMMMRMNIFTFNSMVLILALAFEICVIFKQDSTMWKY